MKKDQVKMAFGNFIRKKRGSMTLEEFGRLKNVSPKTLHKHELGVLDFSIVLKYADNLEELIDLLKILKISK